MRIIGEKECKNWCLGGHLGDYCNIPNGDTEEFKWGSHAKQGKQKNDLEHLIKKKKSQQPGRLIPCLGGKRGKGWMKSSLWVRLSCDKVNGISLVSQQRKRDKFKGKTGRC